MTLETPHGEGLGDAEDPVPLGTPIATAMDADAKIFPFKVMTGRQPAHVASRLMLNPKLFGPGGFWAGIPAADAYTPESVAALWNSALQAGAKAAGQIAEDASLQPADWGWVYTELYMGLNHEIAPAEQALGAAGCDDCHGNADFNFTALGYSCDPMNAPAACGSRNHP